MITFTSCSLLRAKLQKKVCRLPLFCTYRTRWCSNCRQSSLGRHQKPHIPLRQCARGKHNKGASNETPLSLKFNCQRSKLLKFEGNWNSIPHVDRLSFLHTWLPGWHALNHSQGFCVDCISTLSLLLDILLL